MLIVVLLGLIWLLLYTGLYGIFGSWLVRLTSGLSPTALGVVGLIAVSCASPAEACQLDPSVSALQPQCETGEISAEACAWYPFLEAIAEGRTDDARRELVTVVGLSEEGADRVVDVFEVLQLFWNAPDCEDEDFLRQFGQSMKGLPKISEGPLGALTLWNLLAFDAEVMAGIEATHQHIPDVPVLLKGLHGLRELLDQAGVLEELRRHFPTELDLVGLGRFQESSGDEAGRFAPVIRQVDEVFRVSNQESIEGVRSAVDKLAGTFPDPLEQGVVWSRSAANFLSLMRVEDALLCFEKAEAVLNTENSIFGKMLIQLGRHFQIGALEFLSAQESADAVRHRSFEVDLPLPIGGDLSIDSLPRITENLGSLVDDLSSADSFPNMDVFLEVGEVFLSPLNISEQDHVGASDQKFFEVLNQTLSGQDKAAFRELKEQFDSSPHYLQVFKGLLIGFPKLKQKDYLGYLDTLDPVLSLMERQLGAQRVSSLNRSFFGRTGQLPFSIAASVAAWADEVERSFRYSERGRSFSMRRSLGKPPKQAESFAISDPERLIEAEIVAKKKNGSLGGFEDLYRDFRSERLKRQLRAASPESPDVDPIPSIQELQESLKPDETLISVYLASEESLAWMISRKDIQMKRRQWPDQASETISCLARSLRWNEVSEGIRDAVIARGFELLTPCSEEDISTAPSRALYEMALEEIASSLPAGGRLIFVPHGPLHAVPFAALQAADGRRLIDDFEISVVPSADAFFRLRTRPAEKVSEEPSVKPLVLGGPITHLSPLPAAKNEARVAAGLLGVTPRLCSQATEASLYERASRASLLHIAAHGVYERDAPLFSRIQLTPGGGEDGFLHVYEIWDRLDLSRSGLVVLSACDTAAGEPTGGDDIVGLTQAFLVAGAPAVISTLWPVDDRASALLMEAFYRRFLSGESAGAALRGAQLELQSQSEYAAPYFWAGYQLVGDPETRWPTVQVDEETH